MEEPFNQPIPPEPTPPLNRIRDQIYEQLDDFQDFAVNAAKTVSQNVQSWYNTIQEDGCLFNCENPLIASVYLQASLILITIYFVYRWIYLPCFQDFLLAERCRVRLENTGPLKAGDSIIYSISGFLQNPHLMDSTKLEILTQKFYASLTAKVTLNEDERIPAMKAYADDEYGSIKLIFTADKSGTYRMELRYNGFIISGCPVMVTVPPDAMNSEEATVSLPTTPVVLTDGMPQTIEIQPRDRTGYPCSWEGVRLDKFDFYALPENSAFDPTLKGKGKTCEIIGGRWKEGLDASYSYLGNQTETSNSGVKVHLTLRTNQSPNSYGMYEGHISYDGKYLQNGHFSIVSLRPEEYERIEPILREPKATDIIRLKAHLLEPDVSAVGPEALAADKKRFLDWYLAGTEGLDEMAPTSLKLKEVYVNISLQYISIEEVVWTVLLKRAALFSVQGETRIEAIPETEARESYVVTITDSDLDHSVSLLMSPSNARMLMALFLKFRSEAEPSTSNLTFSDVRLAK